MAKTGIVESEMSFRMRRSFSFGRRLRCIRCAPRDATVGHPRSSTAALSERGYIFASASVDAPTQIGACRGGMHKILGMLLQGCVHELAFATYRRCKNPARNLRRQAYALRPFRSCGWCRSGETRIHIGSLARIRV